MSLQSSRDNDDGDLGDDDGMMQVLLMMMVIMMVLASMENMVGRI